jgi:hypothetical protein
MWLVKLVGNAEFCLQDFPNVYAGQLVQKKAGQYVGQMAFFTTAIVSYIVRLALKVSTSQFMTMANCLQHFTAKSWHY